MTDNHLLLGRGSGLWLNAFFNFFYLRTILSKYLLKSQLVCKINVIVIFLVRFERGRI